jgi:preprotein translocase subunit Sec63
MDQQIFNLIVGLFGVLLTIIGVCVTWWVNTIWGMVKAQQTEISRLHVQLVQNYVPRVELQQTFDRILNKLDEIQKGLSK